MARRQPVSAETERRHQGSLGNMSYEATDAGKAKIAAHPNGVRLLTRSIVRAPITHGPFREPSDSTDARYCDRLAQITDPSSAAFVGTQIGTYRVRNTDGHRAVLVPAAVELAVPHPWADVSGDWIQVTPDLARAVKRALVCADHHHRAVYLTIEMANPGVRVTVEAACVADDISSREWVQTAGWFEPTEQAWSRTVCLNGAYFLSACGRYPLLMHFGKDEFSPVVFRAIDDQIRMVVATQRGGVRPYWPDPISSEPASSPAQTTEPVMPEPVVMVALPVQRERVTVDAALVATSAVDLVEDRKLAGRMRIYMRRHMAKPYGQKATTWMHVEMAALAQRHPQNEEFRVLASQVLALTPALRRTR